MKKILSFVLVILLSVSGLVVGMLFGIKNISNNEICYVSLGDSIAEGYALPDHDEKDADGFVKGSYAYMFKSNLESKYKKVKAVNYASSGLTSQQLLDSLKDLTGPELDESAKLVKSNIQQADIITISIGANDILGPATSQLVTFIASNSFNTSGLDQGLVNFENNLPEIISTLRKLNSYAKLVFLNVYNPYKEFIDVADDKKVSVQAFITLTVDANKIRTIGNIAEAYINSGSFTISGTDGSVDKGLNQIMQDVLTNKRNCYLVNVKQSFDKYYIDNNKYDIVNASFLSFDTITTNDIEPATDPHPTTTGHELIFDLIKNY